VTHLIPEALSSSTHSFKLLGDNAEQFLLLHCSPEIDSTLEVLFFPCNFSLNFFLITFLRDLFDEIELKIYVNKGISKNSK